MNLLYSPQKEPMRIAGFMSGSGSNIQKLLERQKKFEDSLFKVVVLFSDNAESNAVKIGKENNLPVIISDIKSFYKARAKKYSDMSTREEYDTETVYALKPYSIHIIAYGGYMRIASTALVCAHLGINIHPADLTIEVDGKRAYTGAHAVAKAINKGEKYLRSTTHIVTEQLDQGQILMLSSPLEVIAGQTPEEHQNKLKEMGDWKIFPKTIEYIAQGRYAIQAGQLYFDGKPIPKGIKFEEFA